MGTKKEIHTHRERQQWRSIYILGAYETDAVNVWSHTHIHTPTSAQWTHYQCPDNLSHKVKKRRDFFSFCSSLLLVWGCDEKRETNYFAKMNEWTNQPCMASIEIKFQAYNRSRWNNNEKVCTSYACSKPTETKWHKEKMSGKRRERWQNQWNPFFIS